MKTNEARPLFRVLAGAIALMALLGLAGVILSEPVEWRVLTLFALMAASFGAVAALGYLPRRLLRLWSRGSVSSHDDLR
ncbi:MAG: hypothetical protein KC492_30110 [Myxococcales bacterium]|nr:hypothetical protein [Myxococcales bacterium]